MIFTSPGSLRGEVASEASGWGARHCAYCILCVRGSGERGLESLAIVLDALPRPSPEALAALWLRPLPAKSGARLRKARQSLYPFARIRHRSDEAAIQAGVTIPGILHRWRMVGCFQWPLVLRLRRDFPSALGCECLQPLRG